MAPGSSDPDFSAYECFHDGCKAKFKRKYRLRNHLCTHEGTTPFKCPHEGCDKSYTSSAGLKRHQDKAHSLSDSDDFDESFKCSEGDCDKVYKSASALKKHVKSVHERKTYKCAECSKVFYKNQQLRIHEHEHTGIKPFPCTHEGCEKRFLLPSRLKAHLKYHEGYVCKSPGCGQKFEKWTLLRKHVKLDHVPEMKCSKCDKVFTTKSNLRIHEATHNETREIFLCPHDGCPRFYFFEKNVLHHISSTHEGKKHACTYANCDMEFKHKKNLRKHLKLHNPTAPLPNKKKRNCRKRRSIAAHLSGHKPPIEVDLEVITKDDISIQPKADPNCILPKVIITTVDRGEVHDISEKEKKSEMELKVCGENQDIEMKSEFD